MCDCDLCTRERKFNEIVSKLSSEDDKTFMKKYQDNFMNVDFDQDILECEVENYKNIFKLLKRDKVLTKEYWDLIDDNLKHFIIKWEGL